MDRELLENSLEKAQRHVAKAERHVASQRELVAQLEREGHDSSQANKLLRQFAELLAIHIADRDRLRKELGV
jgi:arginine repressor